MPLTRRAARRPGLGPASYAFRPAPVALDRAQTRDEVRRVLHADLLEGAAIWMDAGGLRLDDAPGHTRVLRDVARFRAGLAGLNGNPHTAVLDWSTAQDVSVEALAALPVLLRTLASNGARVICCEPREARVAQLLEASGFARLGQARWVGERDAPSDPLLVPLSAAPRTVFAGHPARARLREAPSPGRRRRVGTDAVRGPAMRLIAPVVILGTPAAPSWEELSDFFNLVADTVELGIRDRARARDLAALTQAALREAVANACCHAAGTCVGIAAGISRGLLPALELAVVDNGIGIARSQQRLSAVLDPVPERHFVYEVFRSHALGGERNRGPGRGFVPLAWRLVAKEGARIRVRSGGVLATLSERGFQMTVLSEASVGLGTTIQVTLPLEVAAW